MVKNAKAVPGSQNCAACFSVAVVSMRVLGRADTNKENDNEVNGSGQV